MRASCSVRVASPCRARGLAAVIAIALAAGAGVICAEGASAQAGTSALDPAFRLAAGGRAIAGPIVDTIGSPPATWLLSEDLSLYALTDRGSLASRIDLSAEGRAPGSLLALDPFGRVLVVLNGPQGGRELVAYTRMGRAAWRASIASASASAPGGAGAGAPGAAPGAWAAFAPAFGSDGRAFALSGTSLICLSTAGLRLWSLDLGAAAACPPGVDGLGRPCVALPGGKMVIASPYGEKLEAATLGSEVLVLCPLPGAGAAGGAAGGAGTSAAAAAATATAVGGADLSSGAGAAAAGGDRPTLAVGLSDGRVLLLGSGAQTLASYRSKAGVPSLVSNGSSIYGLDASGEAFALSFSGSALWSVPTRCLGGRLYLFSERLVAVGKGRAVSLSLQGEIFRELGIPGAAGTPAVSPAGFAYSSGSDWVLAAYRFEKPLGAPASPVLSDYPPLPDIADRLLQFDPLASDSDRQLARLDDIQNSLRSGTIGVGEPEAAAYCAAVATRAFDRDLSEAERRHGGSVLARSRACALLGQFGSAAYREPLFRVLEADADPAVEAAACEALAALLVDPDGRSMAAFLAAAARPVDERTALVIAAAIEGMALRSGAAPGVDALRALIRLTTRPYGQAVRNRAMAALGRISGTLR